MRKNKKMLGRASRAMSPVLELLEGRLLLSAAPSFVIPTYAPAQPHENFSQLYASPQLNKGNESTEKSNGGTDDNPRASADSSINEDHSQAGSQDVDVLTSVSDNLQLNDEGKLADQTSSEGSGSKTSTDDSHETSGNVEIYEVIHYVGSTDVATVGIIVETSPGTTTKIISGQSSAAYDSTYARSTPQSSSDQSSSYVEVTSAPGLPAHGEASDPSPESTGTRTHAGPVALGSPQSTVTASAASTSLAGTTASTPSALVKNESASTASVAGAAPAIVANGSNAAFGQSTIIASSNSSFGTSRSLSIATNAMMLANPIAATSFVLSIDLHDSLPSVTSAGARLASALKASLGLGEMENFVVGGRDLIAAESNVKLIGDDFYTSFTSARHLFNWGITSGAVATSTDLMERLLLANASALADVANSTASRIYLETETLWREGAAVMGVGILVGAYAIKTRERQSSTVPARVPARMRCVGESD